MDMSPACTAPRQPHVSEADRRHPLFPIYLQHRSSCSNLMIEASAFRDWLYQYQINALNDKAAKHPSYRAFMDWMIEKQGGARKCPAGTFPHNFNYWLAGGRW